MAHFESTLSKVLCLSLAIALVSFSLVGLFAPPAFAATDGFSDQPIPVASYTSASADSYNVGLYVCMDTNSAASTPYSCSYTVFTSSSDPYYVFYSSNRIYIVTPSSGTRSYSWTGLMDTGRYFGSFNETSNWRFHSDTSLYFNYLNLSDPSNISVPSFPSLGDGLFAVRDYIDNPPSTVSGYPLNVNLPAGNVMFVDVRGLSDNRFRLLTDTPSGHSQSGFRNNQYWGFLSESPASFSLPLSGTSAVPWSGYGPRTLFGQYRSFEYGYNSFSNEDYLCVVNPLYPSDVPENQATNGSITVQVDSAVQYRIVSLSTSWSGGALFSESSDQSFTGDYDSDTDTWTSINDDTGQPGQPIVGGVTDTLGTPSTITDWLENIANSISGFFSGAIGAVTTLVNAARDFVSHLGSLYSWLPPPVYSVLTAAIILAITIGVIKVFL